ncbi:MAG: SMP-30/gluconolactonase/LRE family protein [Terrimicrobiaceae bacterium]|nr:SMP-30/gluconolactonase/LRE family protein [Terrimicrobiaceae bacterium]
MKLDPRQLPAVPTLVAEPAFPHDSILGESPLWEEREQVLYWVDIDRGEIHRFDPATGGDKMFPLGGKVTSIARRLSGGLVATLRKNFATFDPATGRSEILDAVEADLPENRFNDGKCDRQGRYWAGTMNEVHVGRPDAGLYRFDGAGRVTKMIPDVTISNGTGWSPDGRTMYYTDTLRYAVFAYDFDPVTGGIENRRVFYEVDPAANGLPDGLTVDAEGHVWSALVNYGRILRFDPHGRLERVVTFPATRGTCCTFGGPGYGDLYITTARECLTAEQIAAQPIAGSLFHCAPGVAGLPETPFAN